MRNSLTVLAGLGSLGCALILGSASLAVASTSHTSKERIWLNEHNAARAEFGSAPVVWNAKLANEAEGWARTLARRGHLRHSSREQRGGTGENLWMGTRGHYAPAQMIGSFVDEQADFVPGRFPQVSRTGRWSDVGHYTQIVWPETREIGCAIATGKRYDVLVCRYWPAGNLIGETLAPMAKVAKR